MEEHAAGKGRGRASQSTQDKSGEGTCSRFGTALPRERGGEAGELGLDKLDLGG